MHEGDPGIVRAGARCFINQPHPFGLEGGEALLEVGDLIGDVVHAGAPHPPIEGGVVTPTFQTANYFMADESAGDEVRYIRLSNSPTHLSLHARLDEPESGTLSLAAGTPDVLALLAALQGAGDARAGARLLGRIEARSEERRGGKECRSRWSPYH